MTITIENLPPTSLDVSEHTLPAMKDGITVGITGQQVADIAIGGASTDFDTLKKAEDAIVDLRGGKSDKATTDIHGLPAKTTPVDADEFRITDSAASWGFKRVTWSSIKAAMIDAVKALFSAPGAAPLFAARAWVSFNGTGTIVIRGSGNVSSITDNGTGDYTVNFTTAMPDANYAAAVTTSANTTNRINSPPSTSSVRVFSSAPGTGAIDADYVMVCVVR